MRLLPPLLLLALPLLAASCAALPSAGAFGDDPAAPPGDPSKEEVPLACAEGWNASLVMDNGETGIWTVKAFPLFDEYAVPELVGLDDRGVCWMLVSYSGKWTPLREIEEKKWLGGLAHGDVDPRIAGAELYTGGAKGNLRQVVTYEHGLTDQRVIARFPGREIHTLLAGELDPRTEGAEVLVFTRPGGLFRVTPTGPHGTFETVELEGVTGRVRDAVVLPEEGAGAPEIALVSRAGRLDLLRLTPDGPRTRTLHSEPMGMGRIALAEPREGAPLVLYTTSDDGRVLRHERDAQGSWTSETIFHGPQGPRGLAAGRFDADPEVETVALFGYSAKVQMLRRPPGGEWEVETLFTDRDKGHWLSAVEVDGRNATRELVGSGYGARIFLLARPPGYGVEGLVDPPQGARAAPDTRR